VRGVREGGGRERYKRSRSKRDDGGVRMALAGRRKVEIGGGE